MTLYAVFTQFNPTWKYEEQLESLWTTKEKAIEEAMRTEHIKVMDYVWVQPLNVDKREMYSPPHETIIIKSHKGINKNPLG